MKNLTELFNKYKKEVNVSTQYDKHWNNVVKNADNDKTPELRLLAHGVWYILSISKTPIADMSKILTLEPSMMQKVRFAGEVLVNYRALTEAKPKQKTVEKKKSTAKKADKKKATTKKVDTKKKVIAKKANKKK